MFLNDTVTDFELQLGSVPSVPIRVRADYMEGTYDAENDKLINPLPYTNRVVLDSTDPKVIVEHPADGLRRTVSGVRLCNLSNATIKVYILDNTAGLRYPYQNYDLAPFDNLQYEKGRGWFLQSALGESGSGGDPTPSDDVYSVAFGDTIATDFAIEHALGSRDLLVSIHRNASPYEFVTATVTLTDANNAVLSGWITPPSTDEYTVTFKHVHSPTGLGQTIGDGASTDIAISHGLGTRDLNFTAWRISGSDYVLCNLDLALTDNDTVTASFSVAPASNEIRVVMGKGEAGITFGDGAATSFLLTDNAGTRNKFLDCRQVGTPYNLQVPDLFATMPDQATVSGLGTPATDEFRLVAQH